MRRVAGIEVDAAGVVFEGAGGLAQHDQAGRHGGGAQDLGHIDSFCHKVVFECKVWKQET